MALQPLNPQELKDPYLPAEFGTANKQPTNYVCKTLTASETSVWWILFLAEQLRKCFLRWISLCNLQQRTCLQKIFMAMSRNSLEPTMEGMLHAKKNRR